ncbi:MAG: hypothetical protein ACMUJM_25780 [bacterium]
MTHVNTPVIIVLGHTQCDVVTLRGKNQFVIPDALNNFVFDPCPVGDNTIIFLNYGEPVGRIFARINDGVALDMGVLSNTQDGFFKASKYNGYKYGFIDDDNDGINDRFMDYNGDGKGTPLFQQKRDGSPRIWLSRRTSSFAHT